MYTLIDSDQTLNAAIDHLNQQSRIAFDLEFDRDRHTYGFDLCLVQIGFGNTCYIIDPRGITQMGQIFSLFEDPSIQKLVHCPGEDLRLLHSLQCYPKNIADTEVIAKLLNYEQTSLAKLLEQKLGVVLNKKQQQSNWNLRPLSENQLQYAADDVLHLPPLFDMLMAEAQSKGMDSWLAEEFDRLQTVRYTLEEKTNFLKAGDIKYLSPWHQQVMNRLFLLRNHIARTKNKPAFMIMPEDTLRKICVGEYSHRQVSSLPGLHPSLRNGNAAKELSRNIEIIMEEATAAGLSRKIEPNKLSPEAQQAMWRKKEEQKHLRENMLAPVQKALADQLGEFAARYILSNAWINRWLGGEVQWTDLQPVYKQSLIKELCASLALDYQLLVQYRADAPAK